jgi:phosphatidylglycerol---prolipoprotein diacylglyceryl transferase
VAPGPLRARRPVAPPAAKDRRLHGGRVLGVVLGGRIGSYLLYDGWRSFGSDPFAILRVWEGGMSFHGGMIGVILAVAWFARLRGDPLPAPLGPRGLDGARRASSSAGSRTS